MRATTFDQVLLNGLADDLCVQRLSHSSEPSQNPMRKPRFHTRYAALYKRYISLDLLNGSELGGCILRLLVLCIFCICDICVQSQRFHFYILVSHRGRDDVVADAFEVFGRSK